MTNQELENLKIQHAIACEELHKAVDKANALKIKIYNIEIDTAYRRELIEKHEKNKLGNPK